jgi:pimeloyl-ACP methyl ester carboxylesterase
MVHLWFSDRGDGDAFLILHPGGTDSRSMEPLIAELGYGYRIITPDQRGHGRTPDADGDWHFEDFAADTAQLLDDLAVSSVHVLGWSDGSIVGLYLALVRPDLVRSLVFGAAPFQVQGWNDGVLAETLPDFMAEAYGEVSPDGVDHWPQVVAKSALLHTVEPAVDLGRLRALEVPVLVLVGDDDEVRLEHTLELYGLLPDGELAVVPRATHALVVEKPDLVARLVRDFHRPDKTNGFAPYRRPTGN